MSTQRAQPTLFRYPKEDTKIRAQRVEKRRGGNGANLLSVLTQFRDPKGTKGLRRRHGSLGGSGKAIEGAQGGEGSSGEGLEVECHLVCVFAGDKPEELLNNNNNNQGPPLPTETDSLILNDLFSNNINLSYSLFRGQGYPEPTAWIISTPDTRTVVNHTTLPELTAEEFEKGLVSEGLKGREAEDLWFHFEGRNVGEVEKMVRHLETLRGEWGRSGIEGSGWHTSQTPSSSAPPSTTATSSSTTTTSNRSPRFTISIEFEKPNRPSLENLLNVADVLFFSKLYAEGKGFPGAPTGFLDNIRRECKPGAILFLTWGSLGGFGLVNDPTRPARTFHLKAPSVFPVDTIGAGDTFVAGVVYGLGAKGWDAKRAGEWACQLASMKCAQVGFEGLKERVLID
ncbi:hypothetical protein HDV05_005726 [Chytridiales sp. JEL 0842]|nr:hypothetical protein HDV05_005726 [Chytridiales sp. JEL 0842]